MYLENQIQHIPQTAPGNVDSSVMRELKAAATSAYLISVSGYMLAAGVASLPALLSTTSGVLPHLFTSSNSLVVHSRDFLTLSSIAVLDRYAKLLASCFLTFK